MAVQDGFHAVIDSKVNHIVGQQFSDKEFSGNIIKLLLSFIGSVRTRRLIERGAVLEGIFPLAPDLSGAEVKAFLIALSHLPGAVELTANLSKSGDTP